MEYYLSPLFKILIYKIKFSKIEIENLIKKIQAFKGNKNPKHLDESEFYKDIF